MKILKCVNIFNKLLLLVLAVALVVSCQKEREKYYETPEWAGIPIYDVLKAEGRFELFLQMVDSSLHLESFKGNGYWTVFAPNDDAVKAYLSSKSYSSVYDIPKQDREKVVAYSMLYTKYPFSRLTDVLSGGWDTLRSTKKKTPYYEAIHQEEYKGQQIWVANANTYNSLLFNDNNYKYLPMYLSRNFSKQPSDYETFYQSLRPQAQYTGRNVQSATVLKSDLEASNGVVHEVDYVNEPLPNLEDMLKDDDYSEYRDLLNLKTGTGEPYYHLYVRVPESMQDYFRNMFIGGDVKDVHFKVWNVPTEFLRPVSSAIAIPLNVERYHMMGEEQGGYTLFAPNNAAVKKFEDEILQSYADEDWAQGGATVTNLPNNVRGYFINAHMSQVLIYPSEYKGAYNAYNNFINGVGRSGPGFDPANYPDVKPASNGLFYGSNSYVKTHWFETVRTEVLLRPSKYSYMANAFQSSEFGTLSMLGEELTHCPLLDFPDDDYTVLLLSDELLKADGFEWYWPTGQAAYTFRHSGAADGAVLRIERLIRSHTFRRMKADSISDFNGAPSSPYDGYGYAINDYGDVVRYKNGKLQMAGNLAFDDFGNEVGSSEVTATRARTYSNGRVYTVDKPMQYSQAANTPEMTLSAALKQVKKINPNVSIAADWLIYLLDSAASPLTISTAAPNTILLPSNEAMSKLQAASQYSFWYGENGNLYCSRYKYEQLSVVQDPVYAQDACVQPLLVVEDMKEFFRYHIIPGAVYVNDGMQNVMLSSGESYSMHLAATAFKNGLENTLLTISKFRGGLEGDGYPNLHFTSVGTSPIYEASVVTGIKRSNLFGPKCVIHEVDSCLLFPPIVGPPIK